MKDILEYIFIFYLIAYSFAIVVAEVKFVKEDKWIGLFHKTETIVQGWTLKYPRTTWYLCLLPCLPIIWKTHKRMSESIEVKLWEVKQTEKAYLFSTTPKSNRDGKQAWIPRSMIEHISRQPAVGDEWPQVVVKTSLWLLEKKRLA